MSFIYSCPVPIIPLVSYLQLLYQLSKLQILQTQYKIYPFPQSFPDHINFNDHSPSEMRECFDNHVVLITILVKSCVIFLPHF